MNAYIIDLYIATFITEKQIKMAEAYISINRIPIECPICFDKLDRPRSLPCLHTFCTKCLKEHILINYRARSGLIFPCPVCRGQTRPVKPFTDKELWAEQFPINYWIQSVLDEAETSNQSYSVQCKEHKDMKTSLFCKDHSAVACPTCIAMNHRTCENVLEIEKKLSDLDLVEQFSNIEVSLIERERNIVETDKYLKKKFDELDTDRERIESAVIWEKEQLLSHIEQLHSKFEENLDKMYTDITAGIRQESNDLENKKEFSKGLKDILESVDVLEHPFTAFIKLNQISQELEQDQQQDLKAKRHNTEMRPEKIVYKSRNDIDRMKQAISFGDLQFYRQKEANKGNAFHGSNENILRLSTESGKNQLETVAETKNSIVDNFDVDRPTPTVSHTTPSFNTVDLRNARTLYDSRMIDTRTPNASVRASWISSMCQTCSNVYVLCDQNSSSIKLLHDSKIVFELNQKTRPWGVCRVSESQIAVTYPEESSVHVYETHYNKAIVRMFGTPSIRSQAMQLKRVLTTSGKPCHGIACMDDLLFVACETSLNVYNMAGYLLNCATGYDNTNTVEFIRVTHVAVDPFRRICYLTDEGGNNVCAFDVIDFSVKSTPRFVYKNEMLRSPQGLDFDTNGYVYICGFVSRNIHLITTQGELVTIIITVPQPWTTLVGHDQMLISFFPDNAKDVKAKAMNLYIGNVVSPVETYSKNSSRKYVHICP